MAKVQLGLDDSHLKAGLVGSEARLQAFATRTTAGFRTAGAAMTRAFAFAGGAAALRGFAAEMGHVNDLAERFGVSAESIQRVGNAAELAGTDVDTVARAMSRLTIEAAKGDAKFEALGISAAAFASADFDQQVIMLAQAYDRANGDQTKMIQLMDLLGGRAQQILPLLAAGGDAVAASFNEMNVVAEGSVKAFAKLDDQVDIFFQNAKASFGVLIQEARVFGAAIGSLIDSGFNLEKFGELFNAAQEEIVNPQKPKAQRSPFDPDQFAEDQKGGGVAKDAAALRAEKQARAASDLQLDLQIAGAKRSGNDRLAAELEREKRIRADQRRIVNDVGLGGAEARKAAEALNPASAGEKAGRRKIHGYSAAQWASNPFMNQRGFNETFHQEETQFGQRSNKSFSDQSFGEFFHRRDPQMQTAEARAARNGEANKTPTDLISIQKAQLIALEKLTSY